MYQVYPIVIVVLKYRACATRSRVTGRLLMVFVFAKTSWGGDNINDNIYVK